jgi:hypothetical protein
MGVLCPKPAIGVHFVVQLLHAGVWSEEFVIHRVTKPTARNPALRGAVLFHCPTYGETDRTGRRRMSRAEWSRLRHQSTLVSWVSEGRA